MITIAPPYIYKLIEVTCREIYGETISIEKANKIITKTNQECISEVCYENRKTSQRNDLKNMKQNSKKKEVLHNGIGIKSIGGVFKSLN